MAEDSKAAESQLVGKFADIAGPLKQGAARRRIGVTESRPVNRDKADAVSAGCCIERGTSQARGSGACQKETRITGWITVLIPAEAATIPEAAHLWWAWCLAAEIHHHPLL
jgi:hypothetical protein